MSQLDALLRTIAIEIPVGLACLYVAGQRVPPWRAILTIAACSLVTHPFAWWANRQLAQYLAFAPRAAIIEAAVAAIEATLLRGVLGLGWRLALVVAVVMNLASFGFGLWWAR